MIGPAGKGTEVSNLGLTTWLNDAILECQSAITDTFPDFYTKLTETSSFDGQSEYALPDDFERVVMVSVAYDGVNFIRVASLNNIGQALDVQQNTVTNFNASAPGYYIFGTTLGFQPGFTLNSLNNIKLWYTYTPVELLEDEDEPDLPKRFQSILKYSAYANYLDQNDEHAAAERMRQRFDAKLVKLVDGLSPNVDQSRTVEITNDDQGLY